MTRPVVRTKLMSSLPELDVDEFNALTDLLFEALNGNITAVCTVLGINRKTWKKWEHTPPEWPWWNLVLRAAVKHTLTGMIGRRRSPAAKHKQYVRDALARIKSSQDLIDEIEIGAHQHSAAEHHVRRMLLRGPRLWSDIRLQTNISPRRLQTAAKDLGVIREQVGYGPDKDSIWRLPTEED